MDEMLGMIGIVLGTTVLRGTLAPTASETMDGEMGGPAAGMMAAATVKAGTTRVTIGGGVGVEGMEGIEIDVCRAGAVVGITRTTETAKAIDRGVLERIMAARIVTRTRIRVDTTSPWAWRMDRLLPSISTARVLHPP
jgi:hypothetical protein